MKVNYFCRVGGLQFTTSKNEDDHKKMETSSKNAPKKDKGLKFHLDVAFGSLLLHFGTILAWVGWAWIGSVLVRSAWLG